MNRLEHFQKNHLWYEATAIFVFFLINNSILATSIIMEASRHSAQLPFEYWEPFVWEYTSAIAIVALLPPMIWMLRKYPINSGNLKHSLLIYLVASLPFSFGHVLLMVTLRKLFYASQSLTYEFGDIPYELLYEYRKDLWSFVFLIAVYQSYHFIVSRLIGEASLITDGEDEPATTPPCDRLLVKKLGKEFIVKVDDIEWLESSGNYVNLHIQGRIYPTRTTLSNLIEQIRDKGFCRIHRSFAVNLDAIDSITPLSSGDSEVRLINGKILSLSRRYKDELKSKLA